MVQTRAQYRKNPVGTLTALEAVAGQLGSATMSSMVRKGRSRKLGSGMDTLVRETKKMSGRKRMTGKKMSGKKMSGKKMSSRKTVMDTGCAPRPHPKTGKPITMVLAWNPNGKATCVKPGSKRAKELLGAKGCPVGKELKSVRRRVAVGRIVPGRTPAMQVRMVKQCVKVGGGADGARKQCPIGQVLAKYQGMGMIGGRDNPRRSRVTMHRCVKTSTAAAKGYQVVRAGTLPPRGRSHTKAGGLNSNVMTGYSGRTAPLRFPFA